MISFAYRFSYLANALVYGLGVPVQVVKSIMDHVPLSEPYLVAK